MKITVQEYAAKHNISVQSVHQKIKNKTLKSLKEKMVTYIEDTASQEIKTNEDLNLKINITNTKLNSEFKIHQKIVLLKEELKLKSTLLNTKDEAIQKAEQILVSQQKIIETEKKINNMLTHNLKKIQLDYKRKKYLHILLISLWCMSCIVFLIYLLN